MIATAPAVTPIACCTGSTMRIDALPSLACSAVRMRLDRGAQHLVVSEQSPQQNDTKHRATSNFVGMSSSGLAVASIAIDPVGVRTDLREVTTWKKHRRVAKAWRAGPFC